MQTRVVFKAPSHGSCMQIFNSQRALETFSHHYFTQMTYKLAHNDLCGCGIEQQGAQAPAGKGIICKIHKSRETTLNGWPKLCHRFVPFHCTPLNCLFISYYQSLRVIRCQLHIHISEDFIVMLLLKVCHETKAPLLMYIM